MSYQIQRASLTVSRATGVFGIPLEVLVERNGADSMHGAGPGSLRIPSFVDDVISAMKQMGMLVDMVWQFPLTADFTVAPQTCRSKASSARTATSGALKS